jgi:hypothetical protein
MASFTAPGIEPLYSGVTKTKASNELIFCAQAWVWVRV